jgi:hypothetical protein
MRSEARDRTYSNLAGRTKKFRAFKRRRERIWNANCQLWFERPGYLRKPLSPRYVSCSMQLLVPNSANSMCISYQQTFFASFASTTAWSNFSDKLLFTARHSRAADRGCGRCDRWRYVAQLCIRHSLKFVTGAQLSHHSAWPHLQLALSCFTLSKFVYLYYVQAWLE